MLRSLVGSEMCIRDRVAWFNATLSGGSKRRWDPNPTQMHWPNNYHILEGEALTLSLPGAGFELDPNLVSLLEQRSSKNVRDCFEKLSIKDQRLKLSKLEPGDYQLLIRSDQLEASSRRVTIRVTKGSAAANTLVGKHRVLQSHSPSCHLYTSPIPRDS